MNDLERRLRDEARTVRSTADPALAERIIASLPKHLPPVRTSPLPWPTMLAAAALVLIAVGVVVWLQDSPIAPSAPSAPQVLTMPSAPSLEELLSPARSVMPAAAVPGEIAALQSDLVVIVRTVRGAVPF